jgi:hypothetical protein
MVKFSSAVHRDAHYEALNRTLGVALKPAVGKQIFSDNLQDAASGSFKGQFDTERFVFGKIREFTLRTLRTQAVSPAMASPHRYSTRDDIHDDLVYRVVADTLLKQSMSDIDQVPKTLMVHAVAHLLHEANLQGAAAAAHKDLRVNSFTAYNDQSSHHVTRDLLKTRLAFKLLVAGRMGLNLDAQDSQWMMMSMGQSLNAQQNTMIAGHESSAAKYQPSIVASLNVARTWLLTALIASGILHSKNDVSSTRALGHLIKQIEQSIHCDGSAQFDVINNTSSGAWLGLKKEAGFGTAPIWYQQSMATGPPPQGISLEECT